MKDIIYTEIYIYIYIYIYMLFQYILYILKINNTLCTTEYRGLIMSEFSLQ